MVFANERYGVLAVQATGEEGSPERDEYQVTNLQTGNVEFEDRQLANAISYAEHANSFLKKELWKVISIQAEASADFITKTGASVTLEEALS